MITETIINQAGGHKFLTLNRAVAVKDEAGQKVAFCFPRKCNVEVTLLPNDTYRVHSYQLRGVELVNCKTLEGIYADQLHDLVAKLGKALWY